ncbi:discoidin domain-containing protein [Melioribacteraceae bacterium 4301-Me]|uniref:discoidin domain-containing protein n=1 Tax=Pyranulibacter aquaticus TaxID=3163344 RepID=UPI00359A3757
MKLASTLKIIIYLFLSLLLFVNNIFSQDLLIDNFQSAEDWKVITSEGVKLHISTVDGINGKAIRIDYNFTKGTGYGGIQKVFPIKLPSNYKFSFYIKGDSPNNNLEFKLLDKSGENVWWVNKRNFEFPHNWQKINIKKKHIEFAWGPASDHQMREIDKIEFTISSYNGGKGTVYIDELYFTQLPEINLTPLTPLITSSDKISNEEYLSDGNINTIWTTNDSKSEILIDLKGSREIGGLKINWPEKNFSALCRIKASQDFKKWETVYEFEKKSPYPNYILLRELEASYLKLEITSKNNEEKIGIAEIKILPSDYSENDNNFFINITKDFPRGFFPRYFNREASYWTIVGVSEDTKEALINEDGMVEIDKSQFSIEPFIYTDGKLITWNDVAIEHSLEENYLPIPSVKWKSEQLNLEIKAFAEGKPNESSKLFVTYLLKNASSKKKSGNLYLAIRPYQVNPYYQFLNDMGGVAKINKIEYKKSYVIVNDKKIIYTMEPADDFGVSNFDNGEIINYLAEGRLPSTMTMNMNIHHFVENITDSTGFASAAFKYKFDLLPNEEKLIAICVPFHENMPLKNLSLENLKASYSKTLKFWKEKLNKVTYKLPPSANKLVNTLKSNLAYILINQDKAGIQPGSRSYERSWIRDGSLTSSALLKNGLTKEVRNFIEWYSKFQYENGKVPCVVDRRGPDPVPENDSNGEFIYLVKEYFSFTKDTTYLRKQFPKVIKAVEYLEFLISQRTNEHFRNGNDSTRSLYGILPESISHEGYSAKPMHSYWDDFWALKGLNDAVEICSTLNDKAHLKNFTEIRDEFKKNLYNSINLAVKYKNIDYIPGSAELGDFDATSTAIAIYPCGEKENLPFQLLQNTFNKYYQFFQQRERNEIEWINYTPYELRTISTFVLLNQVERAHDQLNFFFADQRPSEWNQWAEVVWKDYRTPKFIGDMPHTWVGSEFINSMRTMFLYENEYDTSLVIGAGLYKEWIDSPDGMNVEHLPSYFGDVSYFIKKENDENSLIENSPLREKYHINVVLNQKEKMKVKVVLKNFNNGKVPKKVLVNGIEQKEFTKNSIPFYIGKTPVSLEIFY